MKAASGAEEGFGVDGIEEVRARLLSSLEPDLWTGRASIVVLTKTKQKYTNELSILETEVVRICKNSV